MIAACVLLLALTSATVDAYVLLPHVAACKSFAISTPGQVAFLHYAGQPTFRISMSDPAAVASYSGDRIGAMSDTDASLAARDQATGDWANATIFSTTVNQSCVAATDASAAIIDALPCDFDLATELFLPATPDAMSIPVNITKPGVYCVDPATTLFPIYGTVHVNVSATDQVFFVGPISFGESGSYSNHLQIKAVGETTIQNVVFRNRRGAGADAVGMFGFFYDAILASVDFTYISSHPVTFAGLFEFGKVLITSDVVRATNSSVIFQGPFNGLFTASTVAPLITQRFIGEITVPALLGIGFALRNVATTTSGDLAVVISSYAQERSSVSALGGRALVGPVLTVSYTGALTAATLAANVSGVIVPSGTRLSWFKFVTDAWVEQGGSLAADGFFEFTTASFSDWSLQLVADPPSSTAAAAASWSSSTGTAGTLFITVTSRWTSTGAGIWLMFLVCTMFIVALLALWVLCLQASLTQPRALPYHPLARPSTRAAGSGAVSPPRTNRRSRSVM